MLESIDSCTAAETLKTQLKDKLADCKVTGTTNSCVAEPNSVEEFLKTPWKSYVKKHLISALLGELDTLCADIKRRLNEIAGSFWLNYDNGANSTNVFQKRSSSEKKFLT